MTFSLKWIIKICINNILYKLHHTRKLIRVFRNRFFFDKTTTNNFQITLNVSKSFEEDRNGNLVPLQRQLLLQGL